MEIFIVQVISNVDVNLEETHVASKYLDNNMFILIT